MATREQLEQVLKEMPGVERADVVGDWSLIATVVSANFKGQDEGYRQENVWKHVRQRLGSGELQNIEFIFTNTPEENAA
jgi:acid stress-induced BolA-like protein IbaG/YrbA